LLQFDTVNCSCNFTLKAPGTLPRIPALATTETTLLAVCNAGIFGTGKTGTIICFRTGSADIRVVRNAHEYQIGVSPGHLTTRPARRTFFLAWLRTDLLAHMLHAPTGLAITITGTTVQEAPFTRVTLKRGSVMLHNVDGLIHHFRHHVAVSRIRHEENLDGAFGIGSGI